jgi:hypothetical protein
MGGVEPGADFRRSRPMFRFAKLAMALRPPSFVPGDRRPVWFLRRDADHGQDFSETSKYTAQAVVFQCSPLDSGFRRNVPISAAHL